MQEAVLWHAEDDAVRCDLCPNSCRIAEGRTGLCGARRNTLGTLEALTYERVASVAADPIEKKPVFHYRPGSKVLSLGSVGCTMKCLHCQNWQISRADPGDDGIRTLKVEDVAPLALSSDCEGVAFTYNEPVIWVEYVRDIAARAREAGLFTVMVTNGFITQAGLDHIGELIDVWRVDIKGADDGVYRRLCKVSAVDPVKDTAVRAQDRWGMHVEVVTNVVPGFNDSPQSAHAIAGWIGESLGPRTPWHVSRFFPYLDLAHLSATPPKTLREFRRIGQAEGLHHVYLGNLSEAGGEDTTCPQCGSVAVGRTGYDIVASAIEEGRCTSCGTDLNIRQ